MTIIHGVNFVQNKKIMLIQAACVQELEPAKHGGCRDPADANPCGAMNTALFHSNSHLALGRAICSALGSSCDGLLVPCSCLLSSVLFLPSAMVGYRNTRT